MLDLGAHTVIVVLLSLLAFPVYGLLRIGIAIGARRAIDNIIDGYLSGGRDYSELTGERNKLKAAIDNRRNWYTLFGESKADWSRNLKTKEIGDAMEFLAFEAGRLHMRQ